MSQKVFTIPETKIQTVSESSDVCFIIFDPETRISSPKGHNNDSNNIQ